MTTNELSVNRFYDRKSKRRRRELEHTIDSRVKKFKEEKLPQSFKSRITGPNTDWKAFYRQQDAFDFVRKKTNDSLHVFAYESEHFGEDGGQRMYLVASYPVFWHYYSQLKAEVRHHYEVIPEGSVCKLYFDLEFATEVNVNSNGSAMVDTFIAYVCTWLKAQFSISCDRQDVLDLDACTEQKFSRHLIFQLPHAAFRDNGHAGRFITYIFGKLLDKVSQSSDSTVPPSSCGTEVTSSTVQPSSCGTEGNSTVQPSSCSSEVTSSTVQPPVKTKLQGCMQSTSVDDHSEHPDVNNENDSSKSPDRNGHGFESPSKEADDDKNTCDKNETLTMDIMSRFTTKELKSLVVSCKNGKTGLFCDMGVYTKNRNFRLLKSTKLGKKTPFEVSADNTYKHRGDQNTEATFALFSDSLISNVDFTEKMQILAFGSKDENCRRILSAKNLKQDGGSHQSYSTSTIEGYTMSPYPEIDDFISRTVSNSGKNGFIRHWTYFTQGELLIYDIAKYRWCANVQRRHRSNNIMLCVDMKSGVYYQKCHDPDCKATNFKSDDCPLPSEVLPSHYFQDSDDSMDSDCDDDDMMRAADEVEMMQAADVKMMQAADVKMMQAADEVEIMRAADEVEMMRAADEVEMMRAADEVEMMRAADEVEMMRAADEVERTLLSTEELSDEELLNATLELEKHT